METIGKYRIEERIGGGGFGEVFRAYDPFIKRHVAIKTCGTEDQNVADRFYQEAEIGGNLHHRNITTVYDFGVHEGLPYLIQEYLSGEDLDVKIKRRDYLPYTEKLLYLLQIARGLAYAHSKGYIHRDVKPANVRILEDGSAKIMDFGIAKLAQQDTGLTQTGMTLGTAAYLSPEQVRGEDLDLRTDIFSFGIMAYELLTYERPFRGDQISTVIYNLLNHEPEPITAYWPGAPADMVALVDRCLRKDAGQRFADGSALVRDLEKLKKRGRGSDRHPELPVTRPLPIPAPPPAKPVEQPTPQVGGPQAVPATAGANGLQYHPTPDRPPSTEGETTGLDTSPRTNTVGLAILVILAIAAAAAGWWLGMRGPADPTDAQPPESAAATTAEGDSAPAGDRLASSPEEKQEVSDTQASSDAPGAIEPTTDPAQASPATAAATNPESETPPAEAATPTPGRLVLPPVPWAERMTVRVANKSYGLHRRHVVQLPPGTYRAVFKHAETTRSVEVQVIAGKTSSLKIPIAQPGAFSVRPLPGRPQGQVSLDGNPLGPTPLSRVEQPPGVYTLEILPRDGEGEALQEQITLESGQEVILSFDLDAGTLRTRTKPLKGQH